MGVFGFAEKQRWMLIGWILSAGLVVSQAPVGLAGSAETEQAQAECGHEDPEVRLAGCSALIASGALAVGELARAHVVRGYAHATLGSAEAAIEDYSEAIGLAPQNPEAYRLRGAARGQLDDPAGAIADFSRAIDLDHGDVYSLRARAEALESLQKHELALVDFERVAALAPLDPKAHFDHGRSLLRSGSALEAKFGLTAAEELAHKAVRSEIEKDVAFLDADGEFDESLFEFYLAELGLSEIGYAGLILPEMTRLLTDIRTELAIADTLIGDFEAALLILDQALEQQPHDTEVRGIRARIYNNLHRFAEAVSDYDLLLGLEPDNADALLGRAIVGVTQVEQRRIVEPEVAPDQALSDAVERAVLSAPDRAEAYLIRGRIRALIESEEQGAIADFDMAQALEPSDPEVRVGAARILSNLGNHNAVMTILGEVLAANPQDRGALELHAVALMNWSKAYRHEDFLFARTLLDRAIAVSPAVSSLLWRGLVNSVLDLPNLAVSDIEAVLDRNPDHDLAKQFLEQLISQSTQADQSPRVRLAATRARFILLFADEENIGKQSWSEDLADAERALTKTLEVAAVDAETLVARGQHLGSLVDDPIANYTEALAHDPTKAEAYFLRGDARLPHAWRGGEESGTQWAPFADHGGAFQDWFDAARFGPRFRPKAIQRVIGHLQDLEEVLENSPDDPRLLVGRALGKAILGRHEQAVADLDRAHALRPQSAEIILRRAWVHREMGRLAESQLDRDLALKVVVAGFNEGSRGPVSDHEDKLKQRPDNPDLLIETAMTHVQRREYPKALAALDRADRLRPGDADILLRRSWIHNVMGNQALSDADLGSAFKNAMWPVPGMSLRDHSEWLLFTYYDHGGAIGMPEGEYLERNLIYRYASLDECREGVAQVRQSMFDPDTLVAYACGAGCALSDAFREGRGSPTCRRMTEKIVLVPEDERRTDSFTAAQEALKALDDVDEEVRRMMDDLPKLDEDWEERLRQFERLAPMPQLSPFGQNKTE